MNEEETFKHTARDPYTGKMVTVKYTANLSKEGTVPENLDTVGSPMTPELFESLSGQTPPEKDTEKTAEI